MSEHKTSYLNRKIHTRSSGHFFAHLCPTGTEWRSQTLHWCQPPLKNYVLKKKPRFSVCNSQFVDCEMCCLVLPCTKVSEQWFKHADIGTTSRRNMYLQLNLIFWGPDSNEWSITPWIVFTVGWILSTAKIQFIRQKIEICSNYLNFLLFPNTKQNYSQKYGIFIFAQEYYEQNNFLNIFYFGDFFKICTWEPVCTVFVNSWPVLRNFSYSFKTCTRDPEIYVLRISSTDHREIQLIFVFSP